MSQKLFVFGTELRKRFLRCIEEGLTISDSCALCGMKEDTVQRERKNNEEFQLDFDAAKVQGKQRLMDRVAKAKDWKSAAWLLARLWPEQFAKEKEGIYRESDFKEFVTDFLTVAKDYIPDANYERFARRMDEILAKLRSNALRRYSDS